MNFEPVSPLALTFEEALTPSRFLAQVAGAAEQGLRREIATLGNAALGLALASAKVVIDSGTVQVVFQKGIPAGARLMKAGQTALPALVDGKTGRILQVGRVASKGRAVASIAASSALIVVEAAHMISGHDNAKRLKVVERGVDRLVHAHESELKSRLEAIYRYSKELLHRGHEGLSDEDKRELHRQCRELMELRARWRDDFRHRMSKIDKADAGMGSKILWWRRKESHRKSREVKAQESLDAMEIVQMMHFSLVLQMALAGAAGKVEVFQKVTLPDESQSWWSLAEFGKTRVKEIAGGEAQEEFGHFLGALDELAGFWAPEKRNRDETTEDPTLAVKPKKSAKKRAVKQSA